MFISSPSSSTFTIPLITHTPSRNISCMASASPCNAPTMHKSTSLYDKLRISHNASIKEIKTAYRALAKTYHPDVVVHHKRRQQRHAMEDNKEVQEHEREFVEICNAYATLSDPMARAVYDLSLGLRARRSCGVVRGPSGGGLFCQSSRRWETDQCW